MSNNLEPAVIVWDGVKHFLNPMDRADAAEAVVNDLIDHGTEPEEVKTAFRGDADIKRAIKHYLDENAPESEEDEDFDEEDVEEDEDW